MQLSTKIRFLQSFIQHVVNKPSLSSVLLKELQVTHAEKNFVRAKLPISHVHLNSYQTLHGGVTSTLVDFGGSLAIASHLASQNTGVSTDLSVSFTNKAALGDTLLIESTLLRSGRTLAFTETKIFNENQDENGDKEPILVAFGSHTKFIGTSSRVDSKGKNS